MRIWAPDLRRARTGDSTGGRATFNRGREWLALLNSHISRDNRSFHFVQSRNVAGCLQLRRPRRRETTGCHVIHMVLVLVPHTHQTLELEARNMERILLAQPQIQDQIVEVVMVMLQELVPERVVEQIVDVLQILEHNVRVIKVILQEQC